MYLTNSFEYAFNYGKSFENEEETPKISNYLFVNKVKTTQTNAITANLSKEKQNINLGKRKSSFALPKTTVIYKNGKKETSISRSTLRRSEKSLDDYVCNEPVLKVFSGGKLTSFKDSPQDTLDSQGNKIKEGTFKYDKLDEKIAVAHHDLVAPAYLIEVEVKRNVQELVKNVLYNILSVKMFSKQASTIIKPQSLSKNLINNSCLKTTKDCTAVEFYSELEAEINLNQRAQIDFLKSQFDHKVISLAQQLSIELSSLLRTTNDNSMVFKTEALKSTDEDYQFILRSINDEKSVENLKVLHIFRINHVDLNQSRKIRNANLYFNGISSNKVINVLKSGYPKNWTSYDVQCEKECFGEHILRTKNCSCFASSTLTKEFPKGKSYSKVDGEIKELSFVFVVGHGKANTTNNFDVKRRRLSAGGNREKSVGFKKKTNLYSDSRGCSFFSDYFTKAGYPIELPTVGVVPAYFIVFDT